MVRIDSSNSWLIPGSPGEREVQMYMRRYFGDIGVKTVMERADDEHDNLVGRLKGSGGGCSLTLYAHCDTVGYELWRDAALSPRVEGDRLIGLGAADDKGHAAAIMMALGEVVGNKTPLRGDICVCLAADEEGRSCGAMEYVKKHEPTPTLVLEASPIGEITVAHQGFGWLDIEVSGRAAHGSAPDAGIDAIAQMAEVIVRLQRNQRELFAKKPHPLNGETVYHTSVISGGTDYATYPSACRLGIEIGVQPGETIECRVREIEAIFQEVGAIYPNFNGSVVPRIARDPFEARGHEKLYRVLSSVTEEVTGKKAKGVGQNSWGDAQIFQDAGFPTIETGAMGDNLHSPGEWVSIPELEQLTRVIAATIERFCA
jgi:acetylornithine deacetylase